MRFGIVVFFCAAIAASAAPVFAQQQSSCTTATTGSVGGPPPPEPLDVDFTWSCNGNQCTFSPFVRNATDAADLYSTVWVWGDQSPTVTSYYLRELLKYFPTSFSAQTYHVVATLNFRSGQTATVAHDVVVQVQSAGAYFGINNVFYGSTVFLEPAASNLPNVKYKWTFGDGTNNCMTPDTCDWPWSIMCKTYDQPGQYTATLTTVDYRDPAHPDGITDTYSMTFAVINNPPVAAATFTQQGKTFSFDASGSKDEPASGYVWNTYSRPCDVTVPRTNATLSDYRWDFGDGAYGTGRTVTHTYVRPGAATAKLIVRDRASAASSVDLALTVPNDPPQPSFTFFCTGRTCSFDASASTDDGEIVNYTWAFGDGTSSAQPSPLASHTFAADGPQSVVLTASDGTLSTSVTRLLTVNGTPSSGPLFYYAINPCRVLNTRDVNGPTHGAPVSGRVDFDLYNLNCGVANNAFAVTGNLTVVTPNGSGYVQAFAPGTTAWASSAINFTSARSPRGNNAFLPTVNSKVSLNVVVGPDVAGTTGSTHLIFDATGYFSREALPPSIGYGPMNMGVVEPCRLYDSRTDNAPLAAGTLRYQRVRSKCGIPSGPASWGSAAFLNLSMVAPGSGGYTTLFPSAMASAPVVSAINMVTAGTTISNGIVTVLSNRTSDDIALSYAPASPSATSHYTLDTTAYFGADGKYDYFPIRPCRILDTRYPESGAPKLPAGVERAVQAAGNCGIPYGAAALAVNSTVIAPSGNGYLRLWSAGSTMPLSIALCFAAGDPAIGNTTIVALGRTVPDLMVRSEFADSDLVLDVYGYFMSPNGAAAVVAKENQ